MTKKEKINTDFPHSWAIVTGASKGIGMHYALSLADYGFNLLLVSNESCAEVATSILNKYTINVETLCLDLSIESAAKTIYDYTEVNHLEVEVLINNAGIFYFDSMLSVEERTIESMMALHVLTPTRLCRFFGSKMKEKGHGYILNMGSISDILPYPGISTYAATKAYVRNMSIALNKELRPFGVHVMGVRPGAVATSLYNVDGNIQKIALKLGIMISADKLARKALKVLFNSKRANFIPRLSTYFYIFISRVPWIILGKVIKYSPMYNFLR